MANINLESVDFAGVLSALGIDVSKDWGGFDITNLGDIYLPDDKKIILGTGNDGEIYVTSDDLIIANVTQDQDIKIQVNDGGVTRDMMFFDADRFGISIGSTSFKEARDFVHIRSPGTNKFPLAITASDGSPLIRLTEDNTGSANIIGYLNTGAAKFQLSAFYGEANNYVTGAWKIFDTAQSTNLFRMFPDMSGANFPRGYFQGGNSVSDTNWVIRFADDYTSGAVHIPCGMQVCTNKNTGYALTHTIEMVASIGGNPHYINSLYENADGSPIIISTDSDPPTNPMIYLDTIANGGYVGIQTATPTTQFSVLEKSGNTPIGGFAIKLTNKTGGNTVAGQLVIASTGTTDAFDTAAASDLNVIGIVLDAGIADGSEAWVVVSGIADVLIDAGGTALGDRMISSATAGSADVDNAPAVAAHFQEIGHCIEARVGAGLARCVLHFN